LPQNIPNNPNINPQNRPNNPNINPPSINLPQNIPNNQNINLANRPNSPNINPQNIQNNQQNAPIDNSIQINQPINQDNLLNGQPSKKNEISDGLEVVAVK
jgi:hypothetical protein